METGIVSETKHSKNRTANMKTSVFATSNNVGDIITPLQSRFYVVELSPSMKFQCALLTEKHRVSPDYC